MPFGSNISRMHSYCSVSINTRNLKCLASLIKRYEWEQIKKSGHVTLTTSVLGNVYHRRLGFDQSTRLQKFDDSSFSRSGDMVGAHQNLNGSRDLSTPLSGIVCHPWASTCLLRSIYLPYFISLSLPTTKI